MEDFTFNFFNDPGHGWLEVPVELIRRYDLRYKISCYSYMTQTHVYLEEDRDANLLLGKLRDEGVTFSIVDFNDDEESEIRCYAWYSPEHI
jgi:hypothetical protein